jgi:hypothetical protein
MLLGEALIYSFFIVPAKTGTRKVNSLDSRLRGNDELIRTSLDEMNSRRAARNGGKNVDEDEGGNLVPDRFAGCEGKS